jgi:hypothetical protein
MRQKLDPQAHEQTNCANAVQVPESSRTDAQKAPKWHGKNRQETAEMKNPGKNHQQDSEEHNTECWLAPPK